jgi:hypothetical protein
MNKVEHYSVVILDENLSLETSFTPMDGPKTGIEEIRQTLSINHGEMHLPEHKYDITISDIAKKFGFDKNLDSMKPELYAVYETPWGDDVKIITAYHIVAYGVKHLWIDIKPWDDSSSDSGSDRIEDYDCEHDLEYYKTMG